MRAAVVALLVWLGALSAWADAPPVEHDYVLHCSACHGLDGAGTAGVVPGLGDVGHLASLPGGRDYLMRVPGAAQSPLDDARLARLLGWIAVRFGGAEDAPAFAASEVGAARRAPLRDPAGARRALLAPPTRPQAR